MQKAADIGGFTTVITSLFMTVWNLFMNDPINTTIVTLTGIGGVVYVFYKIRNERKKSKLLDYELQEKENENQLTQK